MDTLYGIPIQIWGAIGFGIRIMFIVAALILVVIVDWDKIISKFRGKVADKDIEE